MLFRIGSVHLPTEPKETVAESEDDDTRDDVDRKDTSAEVRASSTSKTTYLLKAVAIFLPLT